MLFGISENLISAGFKRIVFLNGMVATIHASKQATFEVRQKYRQRNDLLLLMTTYWSLESEPWETMRNPWCKRGNGPRLRMGNLHDARDCPLAW